MPPTEEIYICGTRFKILIGQTCMGFVYSEIRMDACEIRFSEEAAGDLMRETLLHEVLHGVDHLLLDAEHSAVGMLGEDPDFKEVGILCRCRDLVEKDRRFKLCEPQVLALSQGIWMTLTDPRNREIVRWMLSPEVLP